MQPYALQPGLMILEWLHHLCPHVSQVSFDCRQYESPIIGAFSQHVPQKSSSSVAALQQNVSLVVVVVVIVVLVVLVVLVLVVLVLALVVLVLRLVLCLLPCRRPADLPLEALAVCSEELAPGLLRLPAEAFPTLPFVLEFSRAPAAAPWEPFADPLRTRRRMASRHSSPRLSGEHRAQLGQSSRTWSRARPQGFGSSRKVVCSIDQRMRTLQDRTTPWCEHRESQPEGAAHAREAAPKERAASSASMDPRVRPPVRT